ncbi:hypothetical protein A6A08_22355 [Nocardiopsis sp. TSRI0078]|uniref:DUF4037 domain-containing protein n=1 Tax=unclassified Nocardiopsis TaxID=2649073 RepID=UPI000939439B|nr:DUF4037 domain-containing protein [Nocardiopsis sp. TSRI0078]OKI20725.1 hypothetical protein A6A08_22355 [Nocardiopsis sp. TSRI0078]
MSPAFLPGLELSRALYTDAVAPLLASGRRPVPHAAALLGPGSEVLGLDTERSTDHGWGPRLQLFVADPGERARVRDMLDDGLPDRVRGWPTRFAPCDGPPGTWLPDADAPDGRHRVEVLDTGDWFRGYLGFDPRAGVSTTDWLATPAQRLAEAVGGAVFHDDDGELTRARERLAWYPDDVWRYVLACQWQRVSQEEPFPGRCAEVGDLLGARVVAARLVRDLMRLALLLSRRYPPYSKWLGSAFSRLPEAEALSPPLSRGLDADAGALAEACSLLAAWQNRTGLAEPLDTGLRPFHDRPWPVLDSARFTRALLERIEDPELADRPPVGAVDQFVDNTDALTRPEVFRSLEP